jgi:hypothetical protein
LQVYIVLAVGIPGGARLDVALNLFNRVMGVDVPQSGNPANGIVHVAFELGLVVGASNSLPNVLIKL